MVADWHAASLSLYDGADPEKRAEAMARVAENHPVWKAAGGGCAGGCRYNLRLDQKQRKRGLVLLVVVVSGGAVGGLVLLVVVAMVVIVTVMVMALLGGAHGW